MRRLDEILLRNDGLLVRASLSARDRSVLERGRRDGLLVAVLPGVWCSTRAVGDPSIRLRAAMAHYTDAVVCGRAAASLTFWPDLPFPETIALRGAHPARLRPGFAIDRGTVAPEWVDNIRGIRVCRAEFAAVDLASETEGASIDAALRSRRVTLAGMRDAFAAHPDRSGNRRRGQLLLDSRDEPWSAAERLAHRLLRRHGLTGWRANLPVRTRAGRYFLDVGFPTERVCVEIDGREFHASFDAFENDRRRQNDLVRARWLPLRFTWAMLNDSPDEVVRMIRWALGERRRFRADSAS